MDRAMVGIVNDPADRPENRGPGRDWYQDHADTYQFKERFHWKYPLKYTLNPEKLNRLL